MAHDPVAYMREWRKTPKGQELLARQRLRRKARERAYVDLASRHVAEFEALFEKAIREVEAIDG